MRAKEQWQTPNELIHRIWLINLDQRGSRVSPITVLLSIVFKVINLSLNFRYMGEVMGLKSEEILPI